MSSPVTGVLGYYDDLFVTADAIERLREAGHLDLDVYSPFPTRELEEAMDFHSSPVGLWALIGGITGCTTGFLLTAGTSMGFPLVTQGKPIVSVPVFIVVMFELTVLFTGIFTLVALMVHTRKPRLKLPATYREAFSVDRFGVFVPADAAAQEAVSGLVRETGAVEVEAVS